MLPADHYISQLNEKSLMRVGSHYSSLDKRITQALSRPGLSIGEASFLQKLSEKIDIFRSDAFISDQAAEWLFSILNRGEGEAAAKRKKRAGAPPVADRSPQDLLLARPEPIDQTITKSEETKAEGSPPPDRPSTPRPLPDMAAFILQSLENSRLRREHDLRLQERLRRSIQSPLIRFCNVS